MAASMPRPSRSSLISLIVSTSRLSYWTTTRSGHRGPLEGGDVDERGGGHEHAARVDREVAREAVDAGAQLEPALPVREAGDAPRPRALAGRAQLLGRGQPHDRVAAVLPHRHLLARPAPRGRALVARAAPIVLLDAAGPVDRPVQRAGSADREVVPAAAPGRACRTRDPPGSAGPRCPARRSRQRSCSRLGAPSRIQRTLTGVSPGPPLSSGATATAAIRRSGRRGRG